MEASDSGEARRLGLTDWEETAADTPPGLRKLSTASSEFFTEMIENDFTC